MTHPSRIPTMRDDERKDLLKDVLQDLGRQQHGHLDQRWNDLASGDLSEEDEAVLRLLAEASGEAELALEAFSPLDTAFQEQVVAHAQQSLEAAAPQTPNQAANTRWFPAWMSGWMAPGLAAAVAAIVMIVGLPAQPPPARYTIEVHGAAAVTRGDEAPTRGEQITVSKDGRLEIVLAPQTATNAAPEVTVTHNDVPVPITLTREDGGTLVVKVAAADLSSPDAVDLMVHVGEQDFAIHALLVDTP
jgi:hypothetical protein